MMKLNLSKYRESFSKLPEGVRAAEVNGTYQEHLACGISGGQLVKSEYHEQVDLYVRADGEKSCTVCTQDLDADPETLMLQALENSKYVNGGKHKPMNSGESFHVECDVTANMSELLEYARLLEQTALKREDVEEVEKCEISYDLRAVSDINSLGLDRYYESACFTVEICVAIKREEESQSGNYYGSFPSLESIPMENIVSDAVDDGNYSDGFGISKIKIETGNYKAILSPQVTEMIMCVIWEMFAGDALISRRSALSDQLGRQVASPLVNIIDTPKCRYMANDLRIDREGSIAIERQIVKDGWFREPMNNLITASELGYEHAGNGGRTSLFDTVTPNILYIEPGSSSTDQLIREMEDGIYISYITDEFHSINNRSGDYSIPCGGVLYKDGKAVGKVGQLTMSGNIRDLLKDVVAVGNKMTFEDFDLGDGFYCGGPALLVKNIRIVQ